MSMQILDIQGVEDQWEGTKGTLQFNRNWGDIVAKAQAQLHNNLNGPVAYMIDPTVILNAMIYHEIDSYEKLTPEIIASGKMEITPIDDIPCISGTPVWDRQRGEDIVLYRAFCKYLEMPGRNLLTVAQQLGVKPRTVEIISRIWSWKFRAKLYDMNEARMIEMSRGRLIVQMQNSHQKTARSLFKKCTDYLEQRIDELDPKDVINLMDKAVKLERLSLGLSPDKVSENEAGAPISINVNNNSNNTPSETMNEEITIENRNNKSEELSRILTVLQSVGGVQHIMDVPPENLEEVDD